MEPELSPVLNGGSTGPHPLQGIGAGFVPQIYKSGFIDGIILESKVETYEYTRKITRQKGIFMEISTLASLVIGAKELPEIPTGSTNLTFNYNTVKRYLSVDGLFS